MVLLALDLYFAELSLSFLVKLAAAPPSEGRPSVDMLSWESWFMLRLTLDHFLAAFVLLEITTGELYSSAAANYCFDCRSMTPLYILLLCMISSLGQVGSISLFSEISPVSSFWSKEFLPFDLIKSVVLVALLAISSLATYL